MNPRCPLCGHPMTQIVPLFYSGDGALDYSCKLDNGRECCSPLHVIVYGETPSENPVYINDQMTDVVHYLTDSQPEEAGQALGAIVNEIVEDRMVDIDDSYMEELTEGFAGELI